MTDPVARGSGPPTRRDFLRTTAAAGSALSLGGFPQSLFAAGRQSAPLRILILGGTGFLGPHQVHYALARGHSVTLFNRGRTNPHLFPNVEKLVGDRDGNLTALEGREWDVVLDNSGFFPRLVRDSAQLLKDSVGRYLFVSSISAYDPAQLDPALDEFEAPLATTDDPTAEPDRVYGPLYGPLKALCERQVFEAFGDRGTVVRPGIITGPGDPTERIRHWIARIDRGGEVLVPGGMHDPVQIIDARDLTAWSVRLLEDDIGGPFNAVGPASRLSTAELVYGIRAVMTPNDIRFTWVSEAVLADHAVGGRYIPWLPGARTFMQLPNDRGRAAGLTFRPLAETAGAMLEEYHDMPPERTEIAVSGGGYDTETETRVLAAWHAREQDD